MFRTLKMMIAAVAAAVMMTGSANALTSVSAGNSYDINSDNMFFGAAASNGGAGSYSVTVTSEGEPMDNFKCVLLFEGEVCGDGNH